jgi:BirA family biotin operon repressor/biotin-[acetyl-CoA-carboxylase] ligase
VPELLDKFRITTDLSGDAASLLADIYIHPTLPSTNTYLIQQAARGYPVSGFVCLAEEQTAGKGRLGRYWVSPFASNLYLSVLWRFDLPIKRMSILSLAVGAAIARALRLMGVEKAGVKWPNDIFWHDRKLAGILVELSKINDSSCYAVVGIGINVHMPADINIDQPWIDLAGIMSGGHNVSRNQLAARILNQLLPLLNAFSQTTPTSIIKLWQEYDVLKDRDVVVKLSNSSFSGTARGVSDDGSLLLEMESGLIRHYAAGEISIRPTQ